MLKRFFLICSVIFSLVLIAAPAGYVTSITPAGSVLPVGSTVKFTGKITRNDKIPADAMVLYEEFIDGIRARHGYIAFDEEITLEYQMERPGWYMVRLRTVDAAHRPLRIPGFASSGGQGVMFAPQDIGILTARPADFDEFWNSRRALLDTVPVQELERRQVDYKGAHADQVVVYDVKIACAGSKAVSGVLTMPKNAAEKSLPAIVNFHGAGVYSAMPNTYFGRQVIMLDVNAHGVENFRVRSDYEALFRGELRNYCQRDWRDREKFYFHDMFLRVMRALDYVKSLPQWNGRILVVRGGSQGGAQAIVAAAMDPQVTMLFAQVPAMSDHYGYLADPPRCPGWPFIYYNGSDPDIIRTAAYYDMINFAPRIKCESHITAGLVDMVCPPLGIACLFNTISAPVKRFYTDPVGEHTTTGYAEFNNDIFQRVFEHFKAGDAK